MGDSIGSVLLEGLWISDLQYLATTLSLLGQGVPFRAGKVRQPPRKKAKLEPQQEVDGKCLWLELPEEISVLIAGKLKRKSLLCLGQTSRYFRTTDK